MVQIAVDGCLTALEPLLTTQANIILPLILLHLHLSQKFLYQNMIKTEQIMVTGLTV